MRTVPGVLRASLRLARAGNGRARVRVFRDGAAALRVAAAGAGVRTGLLDALHEQPLSAAELARQTGVENEELLAAFLRTLAQAGLLRDVAGRWELTRRARDLLEDPLTRAAVLAYGGYHTDLYRGLAAQLRGGPPRTDVADEGETIAQLSLAFQPFVEEIVRTTTARLAPSRVLDVGCGTGRLLVVALEAAPGAVGLGIDTDLAAVALAERVLADAGLAHRAEVRVQESTALAASIDAAGGKVDLLVLANVIYYVPRAERVAFLRSLRGMLAPGGTFLLMTTGAAADLFARHFDLLLRAQGLGMELPALDELVGQVADAGFAEVSARRLAPGLPLHLVVGTAGR